MQRHVGEIGIRDGRDKYKATITLEYCRGYSLSRSPKKESIGFNASGIGPSIRRENRACGDSKYALRAATVGKRCIVEWFDEMLNLYRMDIVGGFDCKLTIQLCMEKLFER
ncbi:hypothetical protein Trydic_g3408 [Trypoxylus dichotomus]